MNSIRFLPNPMAAGSLRDVSRFSGKLRFTVPYTTPEAARAALRAVARLAGDLRAAVELIAVQVIPMVCPLTPDSRTAFLNEQLARLAGESHVPVWPAVVLTRDLDQALRRSLPQSSVVLLAVPSNPFRRWMSGEAKLAQRLASAGHDVVLTEE
jgi:hypothetical protein